MKKVYLFIIAAIIMAMPDMAKAQNDYRQAVKEFLENSQQYSAIPELLGSQFSSSLNTINQQILVNMANAKTVADKYLKEQMMDDVYDLFFVPAFSKNMSVEEIREANAMLSTPEGKAYLAKSKAMQQSLMTSLYGEFMKQTAGNGRKALEQGNLKMEPVQPHAACTNEYKEVFNGFFATQYDDFINTLNTLKDSPMIQGQLNNSPNPELNKKIFNQVFDYIQNNIKVMMLNACYESLTIDELRIGAKIQGSPAFSKITKCGMELIESANKQDFIQATSKKWLERYVSWLKKQNIKIKNM